MRALHGISLTIREKETVALLGHQRQRQEHAHEVRHGHRAADARARSCSPWTAKDFDLTKLSTEEIVNLGVAMVPEGRRLFPKLTVEENLLLGAFRPLRAQRNQQESAAFCYEIFPVLAERRRQLAGSMSGGQQQMLAIARALMSAPKLLLVDEPSVGLAPILVSHTITKIKELKERYGLTVLMAEQNFHQAIRIADRGYIIVHGEIVFEGGVAALEQNELVKSYYLGT